MSGESAGDGTVRIAAYHMRLRSSIRLRSVRLQLGFVEERDGLGRLR